MNTNNKSLVIRVVLCLLMVFGFLNQTIAQNDPITLQLKWKHQFQFAGYYAAQMKGFYKAEGLKVEIREATPPNAPMLRVVGGKAQYGIGSPDIIADYINGTPVVLVSVIFQHSPIVIISLKGNKISSPTDLRGKKIMVDKYLGSTILDAVLQKEGISKDSVQHIQPKYKIDLKKEGIDAIIAYSIDRPQLLLKQGIKPYFIRPVDYGIDFYGDLIYTTEEESNNNPERVEAFRKASINGWKYALKNKDELIDYILTLPGVKERGVDREALEFEAKELEKLILPDLVEVGHNNPDRWENLLKIYKDLDLVPPNSTIKGFIYNPDLINSLEKNLILGSVALMVIALFFVFRTIILRRNVESKEVDLLKASTVIDQAEQRIKISEENLQLAIRGAGIGFLEWDINTNELAYNDQFLHMIEYDAEEIGNNFKDFLNLVHPEDQRKIKNFINLKDKEFQTELRINTKNGNYKWLLFLFKARETNELSEPTKYSGINLDITKIKTKELELSKLTSELMKSNTELEKFAYITSHNLRAPVVNLSSLVQFYNTDDHTDAMNVDIIDKIEKSVTRLKNTLDDLIEIVSNKAEPNNMQELNFEDELDLLKSTIEVQILRSDAMIEADFKSIPTLLYPRKNLQSILLNLITNAIKYKHPDRKPVIKLTSYDTDEYICLSVTDNGMGIDMDRNRNKIFGLYQRFHSDIEGKGIGLYIIKSQIESLDGRIEVMSKLNKGTTFKVYFRKKAV